MEPTLITTADGSHSLYIASLNEHYHSIHGAIQESKHVFINAGLNQVINNLHFPEGKPNSPAKINILEIGLGTGLNALLTFNNTWQAPIEIDYTALEIFPISNEVAGKLNYVELLNSEPFNSQLASIFERIHRCEWDKRIALTEKFSINKIKNTLQQIKFNKTFDLIYFDAFGPPVQPEMWTEDVFEKIFNVTQQEGILVTYCAKGEVKRILKKVGFTLESLAGPPGKREMLRAKKN